MMIAVGLADYATAQRLHQAGGLLPCGVGKLPMDTV